MCVVFGALATDLDFSLYHTALFSCQSNKFSRRRIQQNNKSIMQKICGGGRNERNYKTLETKV